MVNANLKSIYTILSLSGRYMQNVAKNHQLKLLVVFTRYHFMNTCWQEEPIFRPEFLHLRNRLREFIEKEVMLQHVIKSKNSNLTMNTIVRSADL